MDQQRRFSTLVLMLCASVTCLAATASAQSSGLAYGVGEAMSVHDLGEHDRASMFAGGGERLIGGVGVGGEFGVISLPFHAESYPGGSSYSPAAKVGTASLNGFYHWNAGQVTTRWQPFVTGGLTFLFDSEGAIQLFNVGAGVDCWATRHVGVRLEARDHFVSDGYIFLGARAGVVLR